MLTKIIILIVVSIVFPICLTWFVDFIETYPLKRPKKNVVIKPK